MQSSTSQSVLIALLAMGLGFSFASAPAIGYPGSGATGAARNPIVSAGGTVSGSSVVPLLLAPPDQDIVITDVVLGARDHGYTCKAQAQVSITDGATVLGSFAIALSTQHSDYTTYDPHVTARLESGILIRAGMPVELQIHHTGGYGCDGGLMEIDYTVSGYLSQP